MPPPVKLTGSDVLTDVLRSVRLEGRVLCRLELRAPWAFALPASDLAHFHIIERGSCWIRPSGHEPTALNGGDLVVVPQPRRYDLSDRPDTPAVPLGELLRRQRGGPRPIVRYGGGGQETELICGSFGVLRPRAHPLFSVLPPLIHLKKDGGPSLDWLELTLRFLAFETRHPRAGSETVITHLIELILIQAVRAWIESQPEGAGGWLGALRDEQISTALGMIHAQPGRAWTVPALAAEVRMSRSAFAARFATLVGEAPLAYLIRRRMWLAAELLRTQSLSLGEVAERVGYDSEAAFSRTFKKHLGIAPGQYRRKQADAAENRMRTA
jgi:AraC-like DNA-binding protein